ncbi:hypothetical protein Ancab_020943 [Ancistrocladus abbreviatus]
MIDRANIPMKDMVHVCPTCLVSLVLLFLMTSFASGALPLQDGQPSGGNLVVASNEKVNDVQAFEATNVLGGKRKRFEETSKMSSPPRHVIARGCSKESASKSAQACSSSTTRRRSGKIRRLLPKKGSDVDAFVTYADYGGPCDHPPKNN